MPEPQGDFDVFAGIRAARPAAARCRHSFLVLLFLSVGMYVMYLT